MHSRKGWKKVYTGYRGIVAILVQCKYGELYGRGWTYHDDTACPESLPGIICRAVEVGFAFDVE